MMQLRHFAEALDLFRDAQKIFEQEATATGSVCWMYRCRE